MRKEKFSSQKWHAEVKDLFLLSPEYQRHKSQNTNYLKRIIPICTPITQSPPALVIGTNHSDFIKGGGEESELIAQNLSNGNRLNFNSLSDGLNVFASNLRKLVAKAGVQIDERWVGTNRCPIQTGPQGIKQFSTAAWYRKLENQMDALLYQLIGEIRPNNLILCGNYATKLIYGPQARIKSTEGGKTFVTYTTQLAGEAKQIEVNVIPIQHPSYLKYTEAEILRTNWIA